MSKYKFEATIKSIVKNGEVEFHIVPTGKHVIKSPDGDTYYVAFSTMGEKPQILEDEELKYKMRLVDDTIVSWLSAHADSGHSVEFEFEKITKILKVKKSR